MKKSTHKKHTEAHTMKKSIWVMVILIGILSITLISALYWGEFISVTDLTTETPHPYGIATNGTVFFVYDSDNHEIDYYDMSFSYIKSVSTDATDENQLAHFQNTTNNDLYTLTHGGDLKKYDINGVYQDWHCQLDDAGGNTGMATNGTSMWIADEANNEIKQFDMDCTMLYAYGVGGDPQGISLNESNVFWVNDVADNLTKGDFAGNIISNFSLHANNDLSLGQTLFEDNFYVSDYDDSSIYKYFNSIALPPNSLIATLTSPATGSSIAAETEETFIGSYTSPMFTLKNATYEIWYINHTLYNRTTYSINSSNVTKQDFIMNFGNFNWNIIACGESAVETVCNQSSTNFTLLAGAAIVASSFPNNVSETEAATFHLNISLVEGANLFAARLNYNGTRYLGTKKDVAGDLQMLTRMIDIPILENNLEQNVSFFWEFEYKEGVQGNQNSSTFSHRVNPLLFQECNNDSLFSPVVWNVTVANETTRDFINSTVDGSFAFWLGTGTIIKEYSLDTPIATTKGNYTFCANRENLNVSSIINVKSPEFFERTFYFNKGKLNSTQTDTTLYLQDGGTPIILQVTDPGLVAIGGHYINVYRFYPEISKYLIVEKAKTDEFGQFVARLIEPNTIKYQFEFLDPDNNIEKRTDDMTIACRTAFCVIPFVIESSADDFLRFRNVTDFDYSLSFSNTSNRFTYTWNDVTGDQIVSRLLVQRIAFNGTTIICNDSSTASSNTLTCDVGSSKAKYRSQVFRKVVGDEESRIAVLNIEVGSAVGTFGLEGLFWAFMLLFTLVGVGSFNPSVGVGLYTVGFIALGSLGIISMPIPIFFANLLLGILFLWSIRT